MTAPPFDAVRRARIGDVELAYVDVDVGAGEGTPVVLLHGLACGMRMWARQIPALTRRARVIAFDFRGHGGSSAPADAASYSAAQLGRDLAGLLDHLGIARARLVGFSLGGGAALALAFGAPTRVERLVLADVGAGADDPWSVRRLAEVWAGHERRGGAAAMIDDMLRGPSFRLMAERGPSSRRYLRALISQHPAHGVVHTLEQIMARRKSLFRLRGRLARLRAPTLVLNGSRDFTCHKAERVLLDSIPGAVGGRIAGGSHMAPVERPDAFSAAIVEFLFPA